MADVILRDDDFIEPVDANEPESQAEPEEIIVAPMAVRNRANRTESVADVASSQTAFAPEPPQPTQNSNSGLVNTIRQGLGEVPPLPHVIRELLRELTDPDSNARSIARIASSDPTLAASLIRMVNSAALGLRRKVTSVAEAVSYLGYSTVRSLVIRMRLEHIMPARGKQAAYDAEDLWVHSLAVAYAAETLAERVPDVDRGFVSTLGLLHDIGKLAINSYFPQSAEEIRNPAKQFPGETMLERERRVLGGDHSEIGATLAQHWKLPPELCEAIRFHHCPQNAPPTMSRTVRNATTIVHLANQLAKYCYVYSDDMEIDIVSGDLLRDAGLPGPMTRWLSSKVRFAISRAVFFADENTARAANNPIGAVRRFLRLTSTGTIPKDMPPLSNAAAGLKWADADWDRNLPQDSIMVDAPGRARISSSLDASASNRMDSARMPTTRFARFKARAIPANIEKVMSAASDHLDKLRFDDNNKNPARFVLRRLLGSLSEIGPGEMVEICVGKSQGALVAVVTCPALRFEKRFGPGTDCYVARAALERELANVLNLRWFARVRTTRDGSTIMFFGHAPDEGEKRRAA